MKYVFKKIITLILVLSSTTAMAGRIPVETQGAFELPATLYFLGKSLSGSLHGQKCEECPIEKLKITPQTRAFVGKKEVGLASRVGITRKPDLVIYELKSKKVLKLVWRTAK